MQQPVQQPAPQPVQQPLQQQPQQAQQQAVGKVMMRTTRPARTVPKDAMGYPMVPGMNNDPGEVASVGADEDGVRQM
jgi:hypothetical protein